MSMYSNNSDSAYKAAQIQAKVAEIREKIGKECVYCGRSPNSVTLVGVTKNVTAEYIKFAISAGLEDLGENYLKEAREKAAILPGVRWHLIGHLQSNKVNLAVDLAEKIHSLDSLHLIKRVDQRCKERYCNLSGLIQVKFGCEAAKTGLPCNEVIPLLDELSLEPPTNLRLTGLMCVPPLSSDPEDSRRYFRQLRELLDEICRKKYPFWCGRELSMGMSADYLVAVQEGATMVRVGSGIFGARRKA